MRVVTFHLQKSTVLRTFTREKPWFCWTLTLAKGEKMKCEVILPRNEMKGEIIEYCFYQTLPIYAIPSIFDILSVG